MTENFYVYLYLDKEGTVYYVGKGCHNRAYWNCKVRDNITRPPKERIKIVKENLSETEAFDIEKEQIQLYKRQVDGGTLKNICLGGPGAPGRPFPEDKKKELSQRFTNNPIFATYGHAGKEHSEESKQKMREKHNKHYKIIDPNGQEYFVHGLRAFCQNYPEGECLRHRLTHCMKLKKSIKGWMCELIEK